MADLAALFGEPASELPPQPPASPEHHGSFLPAPPSLASSLLPRLVRQDFLGIAEGILCCALVPPDDPTQPIVSPMACLAVEASDGFRFATAKALGTRSLDEMMEEAGARLAAPLGGRVPVRKEGGSRGGWIRGRRISCSPRVSWARCTPPWG